MILACHTENNNFINNAMFFLNANTNHDSDIYSCWNPQQSEFWRHSFLCRVFLAVREKRPTHPQTKEFRGPCRIFEPIEWH